MDKKYSEGLKNPIPNINLRILLSAKCGRLNFQLYIFFQIIKTTVATLLHNDWKKFSIIYSKDHATMMETLKLEAMAKNMTINHEIMFNKDKLPVIFRETKNSTRSK